MPLKDEKLLLDINCFARFNWLLDILIEIPQERDKLCGVLTIEQKPLNFLIKL